MTAVFASLNVVLPIFTIIFLGYFLKRTNFINEDFVTVSMQIVFKISLPVLLYLRVSQSDFSSLMNPDNFLFVFYCFTGIMTIYFVSWIISKQIIRTPESHGAFVQGCIRSNYILIGGAILVAMFGDQSTESLSLSIILVIPMFNILAVWVLGDNSDLNGSDKIKASLINIIKNPLIIGLLVGIVAARLNFETPEFMIRTMTMLGNIGTPLGLIGIGSYLNFQDIRKSKPTFIAVFLRIILFPTFAVLGAMRLGFSYVETTTVYMIFGSPASISSFIMAKAMNNDAKLAANTVIMSTALSMFSYIVGLSFLVHYFTL